MKNGAFLWRNGADPSPKTPATVANRGKQQGEARAERIAPTAPTLSTVEHRPRRKVAFTIFVTYSLVTCPLCSIFGSRPKLLGLRDTNRNQPGACSSKK